MSKKSLHQTHFTNQVQLLIDRIYGRSVLKDSMLDQAIEYFNHLDENQQTAPEGLEKKEQSKEEGTGNDQLRSSKAQRLTNLQTICLEIIALCESESVTECHRKSAQLLGTIQLLSPTEGSKIALSNERHKPLYKAVLCLRLLDRLCDDGNITEPFIKEYLAKLSPGQYHSFATVDPKGYERFLSQIKIPLIMSALLQDIGHYHPDAQRIILGAEGANDPFASLGIAERKLVLQISYRETVRYLVNGIGATGYVGNSKAEREQFNIVEQKKLVFIKHLLKSSITPKKGIGNLLKVPQLYSSMVLSTKASYNYKLLPKVYQVLNQNAQRGGCSQLVVDALYTITGMFPQGYGIVYFPINSSGEQQDNYEYAIVNQLYPPEPEHPLCRIATRHLAFVSRGQSIEVKRNANLYFRETAEKLKLLSKERLNAILVLLASNYDERKDLDLLPRCWQGGPYFSIKKNQKIWVET
jgi:hypothetical protein